MSKTQASARLSIDPENCLQFDHHFPFAVEVRLAEMAEADPAGLLEALHHVFEESPSSENYDVRTGAGFILYVAARAARDGNFESLHMAVANWHREA